MLNGAEADDLARHGLRLGMTMIWSASSATMQTMSSSRLLSFRRWE
jgi:hypothetical protein